MLRSIVRTPYVHSCLNLSHAPRKHVLVNPSAWRTLASSTKIPKLSDADLMRHYAFINNEWVLSHNAEAKFPVYDPATGEEIGQLPEMDIKDTQRAIQAASAAFPLWAQQTGKERHDLLKKWYDAVIAHKDDLATILTWENGKSYTEAKGEITYGASFFEWFAEEAVRAYGKVIPSPMTNQRYLTIKQPVGVVGIITPWNFPTAMITRKVGAALAAGCTVVIKPGAETPYSALALCELAKRVGIPEGVVNVVTTKKHVSDIGNELCTNPLVRKISFTGSTKVGKTLMSQASGTMKKVSLELGGNAPFIVFDDADVDAAVEGAIASKFRGTGQTCICANRIYVQKGIYPLFACRLAEKVGQFKVGHGFDPDTTHGPLIHSNAVEKVKKHLDDATSKGAEILVGGRHLGGNFFEPAVLSEMTSDMLIASEETFGPIAPLFRFSTEDEVLKLANDTPFGLAGYFFSRDIGRIWRVAEKLETGMVGVNTGAISNCYAPFGGVKESGLGREGSCYGLDDYMNIKYINMGGL
ncbi:Aldehyde/histidinol dehydrogenase [Radiomyces spectabilis]|uniref:Aldehyde/histidinol dehydrogenase n=1 Tax=Radiomyces spectabilis TaxID=64574 RepID=UPI0022207354|nr:Aldehyde/histidinol dehydrogenase [Radiomyces spectabilis]KAI8379198.1 Aldehyde/histidinol dehydrogenase [Radiomyces spectabilis]